jgi:hypothetical protein
MKRVAFVPLQKFTVLTMKLFARRETFSEFGKGEVDMRK